MPRGNLVDVFAADFIQSLLGLVSARQCAACRLEHEGAGRLCIGCENDLALIEASARCSMCSMPIFMPNAPCAQCLGNGLPPFDQIISLGVMKDPLKTLIHRAKYHGKWVIAEQLADRLMLRPDLYDCLKHSDVIVPVPLHWKKHISRGYNQADLIAQQLCRQFYQMKTGDRPAALELPTATRHRFRFAQSLWHRGWPKTSGGLQLHVSQAARRIRPTETQTHLHSNTKRYENLRGAFEVINADAIHDKRIVLVDDVLTTGATLVSLARSLKSVKPRSLSAIVIAVADPKGRSFEVI